MNQYFMELTCYQTKNKAHKELQQFALQYNNCLIDDEMLKEFKSDLKNQINLVNDKYPRCKTIELSGWKNTPGSEAIAIDGNFVVQVKMVNRTELGNKGMPRLPRPLECWRKAQEVCRDEYIEWHLQEEKQ